MSVSKSRTTHGFPRLSWLVLQRVGNSTKDKIRKGKIHSDCNDTFVEIYIVV